MRREDFLNEAERIVTVDRNAQYGEPHDVFDLIAQFWSAYLDYPFTAETVAEMMILFKIARLKHKPKADTYIDILGYTCIAGELSGAKEMSK